MVDKITVTGHGYDHPITGYFKYLSWMCRMHGEEIRKAREIDAIVKRCSNCFFCETDLSTPSQLSYCKRNPPSEYKREGWPPTKWPIVDKRDDWCGEHKLVAVEEV
jgi:hypothetical protein